MLWIIGGLVVMLLIFGAGMAVGYRRGIFASRFGQDYYINFRGPVSGVGMMMGGAPPLNQHGTVGTVIDITSSTIDTKDPNGNEEFIAIDGNTVIREMNRTISLSDINPGDGIAVIGEPNGSGQILARFIRIFTGSSSLPEMPPPGQ